MKRYMDEFYFTHSQSICWLSCAFSRLWIKSGWIVLFRGPSFNLLMSSRFALYLLSESDSSDEVWERKPITTSSSWHCSPDKTDARGTSVYTGLLPKYDADYIICSWLFSLYLEKSSSILKNIGLHNLIPIDLREKYQKRCIIVSMHCCIA